MVGWVQGFADLWQRTNATFVLQERRRAAFGGIDAPRRAAASSRGGLRA